jgi:hypothetical protein
MSTHVQSEALNWQAAYKARPPSEAIVFIVGGSTYEEAKVRVMPQAAGAAGWLVLHARMLTRARPRRQTQAVHEWNKQPAGKAAAPGGQPQQGMRVLLGGSEVLNSDMFLHALGV